MMFAWWTTNDELRRLADTLERENQALREERDSLQLALSLNRRLVKALRDVNANLDQRLNSLEAMR